MNVPLLPITLRDATTEDLGYIIKCWLESYRNSPYGKNLAPADYYRDQYAETSRILARCPVTIASLTEDPDTICGFICSERLPEDIVVIHYVYVKLLFRKEGVAKMLCNSAGPTTPTVCSHTNWVFNKLRHKYSLITEREFDTLLRVNPDPSLAYKHQQSNKRTK